MAADWFYKVDGVERGPVSSNALAELAMAGRILPDTAVRKGAEPWVRAETIPGLADRLDRRRVEPPPPPPAPLSRSRNFAPSSASAGDAFEVLDSAEDDGFRVEILAYPRLGGSKDAEAARQVYYAERAGMKLKQVRITLRDGQALSEAGALHFMVGALRMESKVGGVGGIGRAMMNRFVTKEAAFLPRYHGTGVIYLEPSFSHFFIHRLAGEEVIADKGLFYCCDGGLEVGAAVQKSISSALFGGEGWFQTRIKGRGLCVLESPVPADEVVRVDLKNETLQVDGNFALMRTGRIDFSVERSTKSVLGVFTSGEMLLQTFRGVGSVWLAPTQDVYERLRDGGHASMALAARSSRTTTESR